MRVEQVRWRSFRVPFTTEFRASYGTLEAREGLIVEVRTRGGTTGFGEASPLPRFAGGSLEGCRTALEILAGRLVAEDPGVAWALDGAAFGVPPVVERGSFAPALAALQCAAADLAARDRGIAVAELLAERIGTASGARAEPVAVNGLIGDGDPAAAAAEASRLAAAGFLTLKLKVGLDHERDLKRISAVRAAVGGSVRLRLDANGAFTEEQALPRLRDYIAHGVELVEQPVAPAAGAWTAMARLRRAGGLPLAADESIRSLSDLEMLRAEEAGMQRKRASARRRGDPAAARPVDAVVVKPMMLGLAEAIAIVRRCCEEPPLDVIVTTSFDTGVGVAMAAHLAAAVAPRCRLACGLATLPFLEHSLVSPRNAHVASGWAAPRGPGLGVRLDHASLDRYATEPWEGVTA